MGFSRATAGLCALFCLLGAARGAAAANLYLTPQIGFLGGFIDAKGRTQTSPLQDIGGKNSDWSPGGGLAIGIAVPMDEIAPFDVGLPDWEIRFEIESITTADDLEFNVDGCCANLPVRMSLETVTTSFGLWFDFPVTDGVSALIGRRVPFFDPVSFTLGGGPGFVRNDLSLKHADETRSQEVLNFAWQVGAGFGYQLTPNLTLTATYRYMDQGRIEATPCCVTPTASDTFRADPSQHDVLVGARILFYGVPSPHRWYGRW